LATRFVFASGSLKQMAGVLGTSYPTVRIRLDKLIAHLKEKQERDEARKQRNLKDIEAGLSCRNKGCE
jgi:hypothetical protein